ncbi:hypothetical protein [Pediococcus pentosaceus]|uniref:hypothetical protein n=1 Tax=Pediococcus pentosaceus TaxID=1255 RepID=UPI001363A3F4|nr:hypothetical protein [Pediococcus pentosaceus]
MEASNAFYQVNAHTTKTSYGYQSTPGIVWLGHGNNGPTTKVQLKASSKKRSD